VYGVEGEKGGEVVWGSGYACGG